MSWKRRFLFSVDHEILAKISFWNSFADWKGIDFYEYEQTDFSQYAIDWILDFWDAIWGW